MKHRTEGHTETTISGDTRAIVRGLRTRSEKPFSTSRVKISAKRERSAGSTFEGSDQSARVSPESLFRCVPRPVLHIRRLRWTASVGPADHATRNQVKSVGGSQTNSNASVLRGAEPRFRAVACRRARVLMRRISTEPKVAQPENRILGQRRHTFAFSSPLGRGADHPFLRVEACQAQSKSAS